MTQEQLDNRIADLMVKAFILGMLTGGSILLLGMAVGRACA